MLSFIEADSVFIRIPLNLAPPLSFAKVYADRAEIMREGWVQLEPGTTELSLAGMPASLDTDSIRVSGLGNAQLIEARASAPVSLPPPDVPHTTNAPTLSNDDASFYPSENARRYTIARMLTTRARPTRPCASKH